MSHPMLVWAAVAIVVAIFAILAAGAFASLEPEPKDEEDVA